jgi:ubiquinone biosynthesis protein COQ4
MRNPVRMTRLFVAVARLARDLGRLQRVFEINDHIIAMRSPGDGEATVADFASAPAGALALRTRPRLGPLDLEALRALPETTLGGAYVRFLDRSGISPESIPAYAAATDLDYVIAHLYETHDLWHVVTGFEADPAGELGVQAFLLAQFRAFLPLFVISAVLINTALYAYEDKARRLDAIARGWMLGRSASRLAGTDWRPLLARPLADVRRELGLAVAERAASAV